MLVSKGSVVFGVPEKAKEGLGRVDELETFVELKLNGALGRLPPNVLLVVGLTEAENVKPEGFCNDLGKPLKRFVPIACWGALNAKLAP